MKNYIILALFIFSFIILFLYRIEKENNRYVDYSNEKLPEGVKTQIYSKNNKIYIKNIDTVHNSSNTVTQSITTYPEGSTIVNISDDDSITIKQKYYGFCLKPSISLYYDEKITFGGGLRFLYYKNYGLGIGIGYNVKPYLVIDRRISEISQNISLGILGNSDTISISFSIYI
jgi:hypothetical protein